MLTLEGFLVDLFNPELMEYNSKRIKRKKMFSYAPENSFSFRNTM